MASLLMLPLKRPAVWIMDLVTQLSVCQQLDCTIMEFHAGHLHEGWVKQHSEWGLGKASADRQCCGTSQNSIFLFVHFLECLWQRLLLQPLMPIPGWDDCAAGSLSQFGERSNCATLAWFNKFLWVAGLTACGEAAPVGDGVYGDWGVITGELPMHFLL